MTKKIGVINWNKIGKVRIKKLFKKTDPTDEMKILVREYLGIERKKHNQTIANTFELEEGQYTKYEFCKMSPAYMIENSPDGNLFGMDVKTTLIYAKPQSILFFQTEYDARIKKGCCSNYGAVVVQGGTNYALEEIFYKKITSLQALHQEKPYQVISGGCSSKPAMISGVEDGFTIRAADNFQVWHDEPNELHACRKDINTRVQAVQ
jgi:hypothetical protein